MFLLFLLSLFTEHSNAQSITEKVLREAPRLSWSAGVTYDNNFQEPTTYDNSQGMSLRVAPRYRVNDKVTVLASTGLTQRFTQENRSDFLNSSIGITRTPFRVGKWSDLRISASGVIPTNEISRDKEGLRTGARFSTSFFIRTNTNFIWEVGQSTALNNHRYTISAYNQPNIQWRVSPYNNMGWVFKDKWQLMFYQSYDTAWTYRNTRREFFTLDESITYINGRKWSATAGVTNAGSVFSRDGQSSNVAFFDSRSTYFYLNGTFNY